MLLFAIWCPSTEVLWKGIAIFALSIFSWIVVHITLKMIFSNYQHIETNKMFQKDYIPKWFSFSQSRSSDHQLLVWCRINSNSSYFNFLNILRIIRVYWWYHIFFYYLFCYSLFQTGNFLILFAIKLMFW